MHPTGWRFTCTVDGEAVPHQPPSSQAAELRQLLGLRDTVVALLETEAAPMDDSPEIDDLPRQLNYCYGSYVARFGPLNRFSWRPTGRTDPETGEKRLARIRPAQGGFRPDPFANLVYALEHFDPLEQRAAKADIFHQRRHLRV